MRLRIPMQILRRASQMPMSSNCDEESRALCIYIYLDMYIYIYLEREHKFYNVRPLRAAVIPRRREGANN